ncbi:MAG: alpha/beta fold hydrolase, partial [Oleispira sp.]|nr:alpha/beta fold hydrolase [Oleispira sp.]
MFKQSLWVWNSISSMLFQDTRTIPLLELKERYQLIDSDFIHINGLEVHYRDNPCRKNPEAPVLLCLHGIFSSLHTWQKWVDQLNDHFRIITIDLPNFGLTGPFPDKKIDDDEGVRIPDILMPNTDIETNLTPPKPEKPEEPDEPPPELDTPEVEMDDIDIDSGMSVVGNDKNFGLGEGIGINVQDGEYLP